jgi:DnaJ-domain-containing protein 1
LAELGGLPRETSPEEPPPTQVWPTLQEFQGLGGAASPAESAPTQRLAPVDTRRLEILEVHDGLAYRTHFEVLGVPRDATEAQVREAYFRLAKRFHPDVHHDAALSDLRDKLEEVFTRLGEAYEVLCSPRMRASYERELAPREGQPSSAAGPCAGRRCRGGDRKGESLAGQYWGAI